MFIKMGSKDYHRLHAIEHNAMTSIIDDGAPATEFLFTDRNFIYFNRYNIFSMVFLIH